VTNPPDQRYTVINAIAKRDLSWAKKLTDEMLKDSQSEADEKASKDAHQENRTAEKILSMASSLGISGDAEPSFFSLPTV